MPVRAPRDFGKLASRQVDGRALGLLGFSRPRAAARISAKISCQNIDPNSKDGQETASLFDRLDESCED